MKRAFIAGAGGFVLGPLASAFGGRTHVVRSGDTLSHLALRYDTTVDELRRANGLSTDLIRTGQRLRIPIAPGERDWVDPVRKATSGLRVDSARWEMIVVHHSATRFGNASSYDRAHRRRGMKNGLAYHFVIGNGLHSGNGQIEIGHRWMNQLQGGHVRDHTVNMTGIGICLVGNFMEKHPSASQMAALYQLIQWLSGEVLMKHPRFAGHKEIDPAGTLCPGRHFPLSAMHRRFG